MRPGVVEFDSKLEEGDLVIVMEEGHRKPLAIAESLWSAARLKSENSGKCAKNLHRAGDEIWNVV